MSRELVQAPVTTRKRAYGTKSTRRAENERLIAAVQYGDPVALEQILDQFHPLLRWQQHALFASLREQLSHLEWEDVERQVVLMFLARVRVYRPRRSEDFTHYIGRVLNYDCGQWLRRARHSGLEAFSQQAGESDDDSDRWVAASREVGRQEAREVELAVSLQAALEKLSAPQREVVWECCVMGRSVEDIAARRHISTAAARMRLESGLAHLRRYYEVGEKDEADEKKDGEPSVPVGQDPTDRAAPPVLMKELIDMAKDDKRFELVGAAAGRPIVLQGTFEFEATGLKNPQLLSPKLRFTVQPGCVAGIRFLRAGVICESMVCLSTVVNGLPHRLVPVAANSTTNVPFAIVEPLPAGSEIEIHIAANKPGTIILDVGCLQMPA